MKFSWNNSWQKLPESALDKLLLGSVGVLHLGQMAEEILSALPQSPDKELFLELGSDMLLAAFEHDCLNAALAAQLKVVQQTRPFLPPALLPVLNWLCANYREPADQRYLVRLLEKREKDKLCHFLNQQMEREPANMFWLHQSLVVALVEGLPDWLLEQTAKSEGLPGAVRCFLTASAAFAKQDYPEAARLYREAVFELPLPVWQEHLATALLLCGEREEATCLLSQILEQRPWQVNTLLRAYDATQGLDVKLASPEGKGALLFYTWNKADLVNEALGAVFEGKRCGAKVIVLNNGSSDATAEVIAGWKARAGEELMAVDLPINVGAPAARNWLAALPFVQQLDWFVYMDDDALVPKDWLLRMGAAMQAYPRGGVYGCRIVDIDNPMGVQSVDFHLEAGGGRLGESGEVARKFKVSQLQVQSFDFGHFSYLRPCASVTGCCHLFRREFFNKVGAFDLRYSPSQYDDLEHDLRHAMQGELPVYQGHLAVRHIKHTGKAAATNLSQMSNSLGNLMKLQMRYGQEDFDRIRRYDKEQGLADLLRKAEALGLKGA